MDFQLVLKSLELLLLTAFESLSKLAKLLSEFCSLPILDRLHRVAKSVSICSGTKLAGRILRY